MGRQNLHRWVNFRSASTSLTFVSFALRVHVADIERGQPDLERGIIPSIKVTSPFARMMNQPAFACKSGEGPVGAHLGQVAPC